MRLFVILKENERNQEIEYSALKVKSILEKITKQEAELLGFTVTQPIDLLISILAIAPPQVRPSVELGPEKRAEDDITNAYARIVGLNNKIGQLDSYERVVGMKEIQTLIASIMVKLDKRYLPTIKERTVRKKKTTARKIKSLEERLVAKEGRFRQHLMGKRVDFSARSVISPDPFLALDEVGVPDRIAKNLTVPEEINELNFDRIVQLCKEGSVKYLLQPQVGRRSPNFIYLNNLTSPEDIQKLVTYGTIAERQLQDGDYVLFNRQPTLHRMSMMAHRVRILPLNTFRLNLSVCSPYNADFDGDEMNMHVPQSV
jgi:DNA-directed RNA polymerase beta' subunit